MPDKYQHSCFDTDVDSVGCFIKIYLLDSLHEWASGLVLDLWHKVFLFCFLFVPLILSAISYKNG